jgi:biopolymer transport protein ExbB
MPSDFPYSPPQDIDSQISPAVSAAELERKKKFWKITAWISAGLFSIPPLLGLISSMFWMRKAFEEKGKQGISNPEILAAQIGEALISTAAGLLFAVPFLVIFIISLIRFRSCRAKIRIFTVGGSPC